MISLQTTDDVDDFSSFSRLPDEIVLEILNKLVDLKTLCVCQLLSKRFYLIVRQVSVISFNVPPFDFHRDANRDSYISAVSCFFRCEQFRSAIESMNKFRCLKSLSIKLPFPSQEGVGIDGNGRPFKTKIKFGNNRIDSFLCLSPISLICNTESNEVGQEDDHYGLNLKKLRIAFLCLMLDVLNRSKLLFRLITMFPLLEELSITDLAKMVTVSLSGSKIVVMRKSILSSSETQHEFNCFRYCYIPLLELPISGYVMKGVSLFLAVKYKLPDGHDSFLNITEEDAFEGKDKAAYNEALTEIFKNHRESIQRL